MTALAPKSSRRLKQFIFISLIAGLLVGVGLEAWYRERTCPLRLQQGCVDFTVARTPAEQAKGLSGTKQLPTNRAMLFNFGKATKPCMWMKDMNYNLDIIWLSPENQIVKIEPNLAPSANPPTYCPDKDTAYVLEMAAGAVARNHLAVGQSVQLDQFSL